MRTQFWKVWFPSGEWGVLEVADDAPGRHEVLGRFPIEARADAYLKFCAGQSGAEPAPALAPTRTREPIRSIMAETVTAAVKTATHESSGTLTHFVRDLQSLWEAHPDGISSKVVIEHFRVRYDEACEILRWADRAGHGRWIYTTDRRNGKRLVPTSWGAPPARSMTDHQEQLMRALVRLADADGCIQLSHSDMAQKAGIKRGSLSYLLERLTTKGLLMLAKPSHDGAPPIYQVLQRGDAGRMPTIESPQKAN